MEKNTQTVRVMDTRVDFNVEAAAGYNKDRDFVKEVDDFIFGGFVDWVRRDETGCYVYIQDAWIPVVDWMKKHEFPGARNLTHLARYFYNLGQMEKSGGEMKGFRNHFVHNILSGSHTKKMIEIYNDEVDCKVGDVVRAIIIGKEGASGEPGRG